jgi:hypothetical protein
MMVKPKGWEKWSPEERRRYAEELFTSPRGQYIVSQALTVAINVLKEVPEPYREVSNIEDMEILRDELFPLFYLAWEAQRELCEMRGGTWDEKLGICRFPEIERKLKGEK